MELRRGSQTPIEPVAGPNRWPWVIRPTLYQTELTSKLKFVRFMVYICFFVLSCFKITKHCRPHITPKLGAWECRMWSKWRALVTRIRADRRSSLAGCSWARLARISTVSLGAPVFQTPASGRGSGSRSRGVTVVFIAVLVEGKAVLGELEDRLYSFLGGRNLILEPAVLQPLEPVSWQRLVKPIFPVVFGAHAIPVGLALRSFNSFHAVVTKRPSSLVIWPTLWPSSLQYRQVTVKVLGL